MENNNIIEINLPPNYNSDQLYMAIKRQTGLTKFEYRKIKQSLDVRKKSNMHWVLRLAVSEKTRPSLPLLEIPYKKRKKHCVVIGSGPAGIFAAITLLKSGFSVTILEQGKSVEDRAKDIQIFRKTGDFNSYSNYAFGEGGAGTFSDGKLMSRTKNIGKEFNFITETMIQAGAPEEIAYLGKPHVGSDNLYTMTQNLRNIVLSLGGTILFQQKAISLKIKRKIAIGVVTEKETFPCDYVFIAPGNSAYKTYEFLINEGIAFTTKPFAMGVRVEHNQRSVNIGQWGKSHVTGLKSADYALSFSKTGSAVYSFCMCPGGAIVPSSPESGLNIVNGVSNYMRNSPYANSAIVAALNPDNYIKEKGSALQALNWLSCIEKTTYEKMKGYAAPGNKINDFINNKISDSIPDNTFPFPIIPSDYAGLLPEQIITALQNAMIHFANKIKWFGKGIMIGIETKTSAPVKVHRRPDGFCIGFDNIALIGQGSGYSGGIITSAVDGIRSAMALSHGTLS